MILDSLERRLERLERPYDLDNLQPAAFEILSDNELGVLEEFYSLMRAGFSLEDIADMLGPETYEVVMAVIEKADTEYKRLVRAYYKPRGIPVRTCGCDGSDET